MVSFCTLIQFLKSIDALFCLKTKEGKRRITVFDAAGHEKVGKQVNLKVKGPHENREGLGKIRHDFCIPTVHLFSSSRSLIKNNPFVQFLLCSTTPIVRPESLHEYLANDRPATVSVYLYAAGASLLDKLVTSLSP